MAGVLQDAHEIAGARGERGESCEVYWARDSIDAHAVRALLEDAGIAAHVENELLQGATGELPAGPSTAPRVRVPGDHAARALKLIAEWQAQRAATAEHAGAGWVCARCGEDVEGDFDICWNCEGTEKSPPRAVQPPPPEPPQPPGRASQWRGPARALAVFIAEWGGQLAGGLAFGLFALVMGNSSEVNREGSSLMGALGGLVGVYVAMRACFGAAQLGAIPRELGWAGTTTRSALTAVLIGSALSVAILVLSVWVWPPESPIPTSEFDAMAQSSSFGFLTWTAILVLFAPLTEELLFRGAMLHGFMQRWSRTTSVIAVSLIFAAMHADQVAYYRPLFVFIAGAGATFALLRLRSGSLVPAVLAHAAYNLVAALTWILW